MWNLRQDYRGFSFFIHLIGSCRLGYIVFKVLCSSKFLSFHRFTYHEQVDQDNVSTLSVIMLSLLNILWTLFCVLPSELTTSLLIWLKKNNSELLGVKNNSWLKMILNIFWAIAAFLGYKANFFSRQWTWMVQLIWYTCLHWNFYKHQSMYFNQQWILIIVHNRNTN